jgi:hypothetical protein
MIDWNVSPRLDCVCAYVCMCAQVCKCVCVCPCHLTDHFEFRLIAIGGLEEVIKICKRSNNARILASLGQVICSMVPSPDQLKVSVFDSNVLC